MVRSPLAVVLAALVVGLGGCGSHTVTKQDFIARANAICASAQRGERNVAVGASTSLPTLARYLSAVTPIVDSEVAQLRRLPKPVVSRRLLQRYLVAEQGAAADYAALAAAARAGDRAQVSIETAALQNSPAASLAARYGLMTCAGSTATVTP